MNNKMIRFLDSINIKNYDDYDIEFETVGWNRFNSKQLDMIITKETPWQYDLLKAFQDGLNTVTYPYYLRFIYRNKPQTEDVINLFQDWFRSIYHIPFNGVLTVINENSFNIEYANEEDKEKYSMALVDFKDFLVFISYEFSIEETIKEDEGPVVSKEEMKEIVKAAKKETKEALKEESSASQINDRSEVEKMIEEDKKAQIESAEDELLKVAKENAKAMARDRERWRLNKRGNYSAYESIGEIGRSADHVDFSCKLFSKEINEYGKKRLTIGVYDANGDAIMVSINYNAQINDDFVAALTTGMNLRVRGVAYWDEFNKTMSIRGHYIDVLPPDEIEADNYPVNRVELHLHSNMSQQDGVTSMMDYAKYAKALGHKAMAVTDHAVLQAYPDAQAAEAKTGVKMLYGCEFYMVDDQLEYIKNPANIPLNKATYVVLDLETTGLSCVYNRIIEFGAVKVVRGTITESIDLLINPETIIPAKITEITGISNADVKNQPTIKELWPRILEFIGDAILVTHNANFDFNFLQESLKRNGLPPLTNPVIDTLALSRYLFPESRNHNLGSVCRNLEIVYDEEAAHRADYDATVLNECWQPMIVRLTKQNMKLTHADLANLVTPNELLKHIRPKHIVCLAKDKVGLKDLFKLVSYSHTEYLADVPKIPRRIVNEHRSHLLIGSACFNGDVFETARYYNNDYLKRAMQFYDYIEIQPVANYSHLVNMGDLEQEDVEMLLKNIVKCADEIGKPVCATGDVHYLTPKEKVFRDVLISAPGLEGAVHPLNPRKRAKMHFFENPDQHYRSTKEMLEAMSFLGEEKAFEITVTNTNMIADQIESIRPVPNDHLYTPTIPNSDVMLREECYKNAHALYGDPLPKFIQERLDAELDGIINHGYSVTYWIAHLIIKKANEDGYVVGSRGSVGSSFAATMAGITEVNALPPHYRCPHCKHIEWTKETYPNITSGYDLPEKACPECGTMMVHDGQDIPFQTFLGFNAEKTPDIDLNFPGDYQSKAHDYTKQLLGEENCFRAGTIETIADKTAFGFARGYLERKGLNPDDFPKPKIAYLASGCVGVKRTTGQHPGGIVVVPRDNDVYDFTPVQYPADDKEASWKTTHFDFESIHDTLLKLDLLGHVDPVALRMMCNLTNINIKDIPLNDPKVLSIFSSPAALNMEHDYTNAKTGALAIPEFGTEFVRGMLEETKPQTFADLVIISGLSHGTNVWNGNADELVRGGKALSEVIGCRDDIMTYLIGKGLPKDISFTIMEKVRKGKGLKEEWEQLMKANKVPDYYIESCKKIKYMFPKGHAVAYVTMAIRVGYFKVYYPLVFYATFFSVRSKQYDIEPMIKGRQAIIERIEELKAKGNKGSKEKLSNKEAEQLKTLYIALEMVQRGYKFSNISLEKSDAENFVVDEENKALIPPFTTIDQLGKSAADSVIEARKQGRFISKEDLLRRTKLSKTNVEDLARLHVLDDLTENDQLSLFDF